MDGKSVRPRSQLWRRVHAPRRRSITRLPLVGRLANRLGKIYAANGGWNVDSWLQADLQPPEIDFRVTPNTGHSEAHAGLPLLTPSGSQLGWIDSQKPCWSGADTPSRLDLYVEQPQAVLAIGDIAHEILTIETGAYFEGQAQSLENVSPAWAAEA